MRDVYVNDSQPMYKEKLKDNEIKKQDKMLQCVTHQIPSSFLMYNQLSQIEVTVPLEKKYEKNYISICFGCKIKRNEFIDMFYIQDFISVNEDSYKYLFYHTTSYTILQEFIVSCIEKKKYTKFFYVLRDYYEMAELK